MHGLVNRTLQRFAEHTFGNEIWARATRKAAPGAAGFEALLSADAQLTEALIAALGELTGTPREMLLEDMGTWLTAHPGNEGLRRLLRFGGETYSDFLYSLEELADRVRLAMPDLILPPLSLREHAPGRFSLSSPGGLPGYAHVLIGLLRAMADDYGALAVAELVTDGPQGMRIAVNVAEAAFAEGRHFTLAERREFA